MAVEVDFRDEKAYAVFTNSLPKDFSPVNQNELETKAELFNGKNQEVNKELLEAIKEKIGIPKPKDPAEQHSMFNDLLAAAEKSSTQFNEVKEAAEKSDSQFNQLLESADKIVEKIQKEQPELNPEDKAIIEESKNVEPEKGEVKSVMVDVNPSTGERVIRGNGEFKPDETDFNTVLEADNKSDALSDTPVDDSTIAKEIKEKFDNISDKDLIAFVDVAQQYKAKQISSNEAFNKLPQLMKDKINSEIVKAGIPVGTANNYRKQAVKSILEEILNGAEMEQCSVDLDKQIAKIYNDYGNDVSFLYQSNMYEKIKTLQQSISDMEKDNIDGSLNEKIEKINDIINSLYESFELDDFAQFAICTKIKNMEAEKPHKVFRDFVSKYDDSKFIISDVALIIEPLKKFCSFTEKEATDMAILFCKYCTNMRPSNLAEHTFMYYFISNILSLTVNGIINDEINENQFSEILIDNLKNIMTLRKMYLASDRSKVPTYTFRSIDKDYMNKIIEKAAQRTKEIEEENKKIEEELAVEESEEEIEESAEEKEELLFDERI